MRRRRIALAIALIAVTLSIACHKNVVPHPNQINAFDGQTYDTLVSAQGALDEAKVQYRSGKLPPDAKAVINGAGAAYEQARASWQLWRDTVLGLRPGDQQQLEAKLKTELQELSAALSNIRRFTGDRP